MADVSVPLPDGSTTTTHYVAESPSGAALVLAHGAGAGHRHPFMVTIARRLAALGIDVITFNFPYMEQKRRMPDRAPVLETCFRLVVQDIRGREALRGRRIFIGGKSMGGRMATHLAAQQIDGIEGAVVLGYPLHPPGKPEQLRTAHFPDIRMPLLIVQGERDPFGTPQELRPAIALIPADVTLHVVEGGDHSLAVRAAGKEAAIEHAANIIAAWLAAAHRPASVHAHPPHDSV